LFSETVEEPEEQKFIILEKTKEEQSSGAHRFLRNKTKTTLGINTAMRQLITNGIHRASLGPEPS